MADWTPSPDALLLIAYRQLRGRDPEALSVTTSIEDAATDEQAGTEHSYTF
jgi:hypothetical protein